MIHKRNIYAGVCWSSTVDYEEGVKTTHPTKTNPGSGFVTILNHKNKVISNPGGTTPIYKGGELQRMLQQESIFRHCHDVCIDNDENLYVYQWNANNSYPIKLERV